MILPLLNLFFPQICLGCRAEGSFACADCLSLIPIARHLSPLPNHSWLAGLFCAASYEDKLVQRLLHSFKYQPFVRGLAKPLAFLIVSHFALCNNAIYPPHVICPVPLHKKRLKWRGYNHAEELANQLGYAFSVPVVSNALVKTKNTSPQVTLNKEQRMKSMKGAFEVPHAEHIQGKTILLVDDVFTTGATMPEKLNNNLWRFEFQVAV